MSQYHFFGRFSSHIYQVIWHKHSTYDCRNHTIGSAVMDGSSNRNRNTPHDEWKKSSVDDELVLFLVKACFFVEIVLTYLRWGLYTGQTQNHNSYVSIEKIISIIALWSSPGANGFIDTIRARERSRICGVLYVHRIVWYYQDTF